MCGDGVWTNYTLNLPSVLPVLYYFCATQLSAATTLVGDQCEGAPHQCDSGTCLLTAHLPPAATYVRSPSLRHVHVSTARDLSDPELSPLELEEPSTSLALMRAREVGVHTRQVDVMAYAEAPSEFQVQLSNGTVAAVGVCAARLAGPLHNATVVAASIISGSEKEHSVHCHRVPLGEHGPTSSGFCR